MPDHLLLLPGTLRRVCQLTGAWQRDGNGAVPAINKAECERVKLEATDLGASFSVGVRTYFLFGDSSPGSLLDPVAFTTDMSPERGVHLTFLTDEASARLHCTDRLYRHDAIWTALRVGSIDSGMFCVPHAGFAGIAGDAYVVITTDLRWDGDWAVMGKSWLMKACATAGGHNFAGLQRIGEPISTCFAATGPARSSEPTSTPEEDRHHGRFINVAPVRVDRPIFGGPFAEATVFFFGTGRYRRSDVYLAAAPLARVEDRSSWRYFSEPTRSWRRGEAEATPLINPRLPDPRPNGYGELSVAWVEALGRWLMIATRDHGPARQLVYFSAPRPWGPWDGPRDVFGGLLGADLWRGLLHEGWTPGSFASDRLSDKGRGEIGGIEYGGYIVDRFTTTVRPGVADVYFSVSTWNPYQVTLMCARFVSGHELFDGPLQVTTSLVGRVARATLDDVRRAGSSLARSATLVIDRVLSLAAPQGTVSRAINEMRARARRSVSLDKLALRPSRRARLVGGVSLIQSRFGKLQRNFELVAPAAHGGLWVRAALNDGPAVTWGATIKAGALDMFFDAVSIIEFRAEGVVSDNPLLIGAWDGRLIVAGIARGRVAYLWRDRNSDKQAEAFRWHGPFPVIAVENDDSRHPFANVRGNPALLQSTFGQDARDLQLIAPDETAGIRHYLQNNAPRFPFFPDWQVAPTFGQHLGRVDAVAMIQGRFGAPGNLEVVARCGSRLHHCFRAGLTWDDRPIVVAGQPLDGATGVPALALSRFGEQARNFELLTPLANGGLALYFRDNDAADPRVGAWHFAELIDGSTSYCAVSLIHATTGGVAGELHAVATTVAGEVVHLKREAGRRFARGDVLFSL